MTQSLLIDYVTNWMAEVPVVWEATHLSEPGMRGVFFDSVPFRGKPTRNFAWIGLPESATTSQPVPAMILVHGGGGTAFSRWVRWWNEQGYAAIAMDTCGSMPLPNTGIEGSADWPRHSHSGPPGWGGVDQLDQPPEDQWTFHAAAGIVRAHTLLASLPEVDADRIGITGISWGGFLTSIIAGLDPRLRCAMPVYGCGFIHKSPAWPELSRLTPEQLRFFNENWDPSALLPKATCPMLWLNGTNDFAYTPPIWQRSVNATQGPHQLCLKPRYPHGHIPAAEQARELKTFANACLNDNTPLIKIKPPKLDGSMLSAHYGDERPLRSATLLMTPDSGPWPDREWHVLPTNIDRTQNIVSVPLPTDTTAACFSFISEDWLTATSDVVFP